MLGFCFWYGCVRGELHAKVEWTKISQGERTWGGEVGPAGRSPAIQAANGVGLAWSTGKLRGF